MTLIQLDMLKSYPDSSLNRDDIGRVKTSNFGGVNRTRISSQCNKRAWRTSDVFSSETDGSISIRTRSVKEIVNSFSSIKDRTDDEKEKIIKAIKNYLNGSEKSEVMASLSNNELKKLEKQILENEEIKFLEKQAMDCDVALWGRMLASNTDYNVDAACQVSHAITTHETISDTDYFTAVDDLVPNGSGHIDENDFSNGVFHCYVSINLEKLIENLDGDKKKAKMAISGLIKSMMMVSPSGKQNSFAGHSFAEMLMVRSSKNTPVSLINAFLQPVSNKDEGRNILEKSKVKLLNYYNKLKNAYSLKESVLQFDLEKSDSSLEKVVEFLHNSIDEV